MANVIPVTLPAEAEIVPCHYVAEVTDGSSHTFGAGSSFTVPAGWAGEWRGDQPFMKYFALSIPPA